MTVLTIMDVLSAASTNDMQEMNTIQLSELFLEAVRAELSKLDGPQPLSNMKLPRGAEEIRSFWTKLCINGTFKADHAVCKQDNVFTRDPKVLILSNKEKHKTFNALSAFNLGNKVSGKNGGSSYKSKDDQKVGSGANGNTVSSSAQKIINQANIMKTNGESSENSSESKPRSVSVPVAAKPGSSSGKSNLTEFGDKLTAGFQQLLQDEIKILTTKYDGMENEINNAKETAINATNTANEARKAADQNTTIINGVKEDINANSSDLNDIRGDLDIQTRKLTTLTNEFHALDTTGIKEPETIEGYMLIQYYTLSKNCRAEYRKAVLMMKFNGLIVLDVNPDENETYIDVNVDNPRGSTARCLAIEEKLATDAEGRFDVSKRVKIKKATVVKRKSEKFAILVQIDAINKVRGNIVERLINDRHTNSGHFGLRQDIPDHYNIDSWLIWLKNNVIDSATGRKLIFGFDTNKSGYYVIYINDHEDKDADYPLGTINRYTNKPYTNKEKCSIIRPGCPRELAKLKLKYLTKDNLLKLTKPNEYFCYGGHILKVPDNEMFEPVRVNPLR